MSPSKQHRYVEPCQCGACPKLPSNRPPTKRETLAHVSHKYERYWDEERIVLFSIDLYVHTYRRWVNERGWSKPPEWASGRVPLHEVRKGVIFPEEARAWARRLRAGYQERRGSEAGA